MKRLFIFILIVILQTCIYAIAEASSKPVLIKDILFTGNKVISTEKLRKATETFVDQELTIDDMKSVVEMVTMTYQEAGYVLARAYLPEQEIKSGYLIVAVIEGKIDKIEVTGTKYYKDRVLKRYFQEQLKHGVVNETFLERALLLAKDIPDADTQVVLKSGSKPGTVDLVLPSEDRFAYSFGFDYNNFGSEYVGEDRYGAHVEVTDPYWGSTFSLRGVTGKETDDSSLLSFEYAIPVNHYGTQVSVRYLKGLYGVGQDLADLGLAGNTRVYGGGLIHPFIRKRDMNLVFDFRYDHKKTRNYVNETETLSTDELDVFSIGLNFDNVDKYLGKNIVSAKYIFGFIKSNSTKQPARMNPDEHFDVVSINLARIQKIYGHTNLMLRISGQATNDRLLSVQQMVIGGYGTVRGHKASLFLGDKGINVSAELMTAPPFLAEKNIFGKRVSQMFQLAAFYDHGHVYNASHKSGEYGNRDLSGYGVGLRLFYNNFTLRYDVGFPTGKDRAGRTEKEEPWQYKRYYYLMCSAEF